MPVPLRIPSVSRRRFLGQSLFAVGAAGLHPDLLRAAAPPRSANDRPVIGAIGVGWTPQRTGRGTVIARQAAALGDLVAVCDVDRLAAEKARETLTSGQARVYTDYRKLLERDEIHAVTIGTPDHWHTKIAIEAMQAGKDVYCEKPLTLTIDEGKWIRQVQRETGRVFQVGTQQRSEYKGMFLTAVALARSGRIGDLRRITCSLGRGEVDGPFATEKAPAHLDWDFWLGPAPRVPYRAQRAHHKFRWWYEYSGGKLTDWGAHHIDIAQWALGMEESGPVEIEGRATHPVPLANGQPTLADRFNCAETFRIRCRYANDAELLLLSDGENGITFEGTKGSFFVSRRGINGAPVRALEKDPLPGSVIADLMKGKPPGDHMANFFACLRDRGEPVSDVATHHRSMTTCHLANIAIRLNRPLHWDPKTETIVGDPLADGFRSRPYRKGYEIEG